MSQRIGEEWERRQREMMTAEGGGNSLSLLSFGYGPVDPNSEFAKWLQAHPESKNYGKSYSVGVKDVANWLKAGGALAEEVSKWSAIGGGVCFPGGAVSTMVPGTQPAAPFLFGASGYLFTVSGAATFFSLGCYGIATILDSKDQEAQGGFVKNAILVGIDVGLKWATKGVSSMIFKPAVQGVDDLTEIGIKKGGVYVKKGYQGAASWFGSSYKPGQYISAERLQMYVEYQKELSRIMAESKREAVEKAGEVMRNVTSVAIDEMIKKYQQNYNTGQFSGVGTNSIGRWNNWYQYEDRFRCYGYNTNWR